MKTSSIVWIIVAVVVSAAIVSFSLYQKQISDWFATLAMKSTPNNQSQTQSQPRTYNIKEVANSIATGVGNLQ